MKQSHGNSSRLIKANKNEKQYNRKQSQGSPLLNSQISIKPPQTIRVPNPLNYTPTREEHVKPTPRPSKRQLKSCSLSAGISSLTYGLACLIFQLQSNSTYECLMMIHEQYINILHLIISRQTSHLLKLNDVKYITVEDTFITGKLANLPSIPQQMKENYIMLTLNSLKTVVFIFKTESQKQIIYMGLKLFLHQARLFYDKLSQYDPFKAESMMLFLEADKDGGNLLDIEEIISILSQLKINKEKLDIQADVLEINKFLYDRQNLKRPKNASTYQLTPIAFEYLLRYYSMKQQLSKYFKQYCPMFKNKTKNHKNTIIDIIKNNQKPIMSSSQLMGFYHQLLGETQRTQSQLQQMIKKFPIYDGQGKEKFDIKGQQTLISFDNFCNLIYSKQNSLIQLDKAQFCDNQDSQCLSAYTSMANRKKTYKDYPLLDYYVYSDLSFRNPRRKQKTNFFHMALKRGVKCLTLTINISMHHKFKEKNPGTSPTKLKGSNTKLSPLVVRIDEKQQEQVLIDDILKDIKTYAFEKNNLPFFIVVDFYSILTQSNYQQYLELFNQIIDDSLEKQCIFIHNGSKHQKKSVLPSPGQLEGKFILVTNYNPKMSQKIPGKQNQVLQIPASLMKRFAFNAARLDFERKGQNCWNSCFIQDQQLRNYESAQQQNISNYSRKLMLFWLPGKQASLQQDPFTCFRQGVQFAGQNYQKNKQGSYLSHSKFSQVPLQYFGYLLKPSYMLSCNSAPLYSNKNFTRQLATRIKFCVLSGQKLILNGLPFRQFHVEVEVIGNRQDQQNNKRYKSEKRTQGFYTEIGLECEFLVYNQELFTVMVQVRNSQNDKILAARAVSLKAMREGLRTLQLFGDKMQTKQNSYLLVHYTKKEINLNNQKANKMQQFLK